MRPSPHASPDFIEGIGPFFNILAVIIAGKCMMGVADLDVFEREAGGEGNAVVRF